ncbi:phage baseplate assembly protein [Candidatus Pacearchaeota archaeon]|nr:phage baseplate assembly protein [Candidatus Pacearchaeota archaeon]
MMKKLFNLIKRGIITLSSKDTAVFPTIQMTYLGKTKNVELVLPYGLYSNPKEGAIALMFQVNGQEENMTAIPYDPYTRFKNLQPGEVAVGNPHTQSKILFKANGDIELEANGAVNINAPNIHLGEGGEPIARVGDQITGEVIIPSGSSAGTYPVTTGVISTGSPNNTST